MAVPDVSGSLREALTACAAGGLTGVLRVAGDPGGVVHLIDGGLAAIATPGAPSAEVILLRSGRVSEAGWDAAFTASAASGTSMCAELVASSAAGTGELEALLRIALADAMFVLATGLVEECEPRPSQVDCLLALEPAADFGPLLAEAARRVRVLGATVGERDRFVVVPAAKRSGPPLSSGQDEIVTLADGRRTARDIAFASGRGVYATMLQLARLREAGVLTAVRSGPASAARERAPGTAGPAASAGSAAGDRSDAPGGLPRREKGLPSLPRRTVDARVNVSRTTPHRLLRPRSGGDVGPLGAE